MKKADVVLGATYRAKVSGQLVDVKIGGHSPHGGWYATNLATGRPIRIRTAARLRPAVARGQVFYVEGGWPGSNPHESHRCLDHAVPYVSDGVLGHGWECAACGALLQVG